MTELCIWVEISNGDGFVPIQTLPLGLLPPHQDVVQVCLVALRAQVSVEGTEGDALPWSHRDESPAHNSLLLLRQLHRIHYLTLGAKQLLVTV